MPTGVPIRDIRDQLLDAAVRVLLRDGPDALTSRAVTAEAGVAKGILHRHFADFDTFLATLVLTHIERLQARAAELRAAAGTATVEGNVAQALALALDPTVTAIVDLTCSRRALLDRLRLTTPTGIPLLTEATAMIANYLTAERGLGRLPVDTDVDALALLLVGGAHLLTAGDHRTPPDPQGLHDLTTSALANHERPRHGARAQSHMLAP